MRKVIDIEANNLLGPALDYSKLPFKLKYDYRVWCVVVRNIDTGAVSSLIEDAITKEAMEKLLEGTTELIGHNIVTYDLPVLMLYGVLDYEVGYPGKPSLLFGNPVVITDTLIWSKLTNADRLGGHSLASWGKRLGNYKGDFHEWDKYSDEMLEYCIQDTNVNKDIYYAVLKEAGKHFTKAYSVELKLADLTLRQEIFGFDFNVKLAEANIKDLDEKMLVIATKVNPILPPKRMTQAKLKLYTPPKIQLKKDGTISSVMEKFMQRHNATYNDDFHTMIYKEKEYELPWLEPLESHEVATVNDIDVVKGYLLSLGWVPTEVKERDLVKKADKTTKNRTEIIATIDRYVEQSRKGEFGALREDLLDVKLDEMRKVLIARINETKPIYVPSSPKLAVGLDKEICKNLVSLGKKAEFVKDVVEYFTFRHRRNAIAGGALDEDGEPITGFLSNIREDGRIPTPADTLGANTGRYRHKIVCNVPRNTSLYGEQMRSMFGAGKGLYQLGYDFASLEARIMGHYVLPYTDGESLAEALVASKPNDIHCYREDTEILTKTGWKTFGLLTKEDYVAQFDKGIVEFVKPTEIVWQHYEGEMYTDPTTGYSVTPNHRVYLESYTAKTRALDYSRIEEAAKFKPSSDKRYKLGGKIKGGDYVNLSDTEIQLLVAIQADAYLMKDCSGIAFTFVKQRKIERLKTLLDKISIKYTVKNYFRKGRNEVQIYLTSSPSTVKLRSYVGNHKTLNNNLLVLSSRQMTVMLDEVQYWDGTTKDNGDICIDTTSKETVDFIQTACSLTERKCKVSQYTKKTNFGVCEVYRAYVSVVSAPNYLTANKQLNVEKYSGYIGCVSVPSGLVLVRRNNCVLVSGNTINARKLGIERDAAKSFSYASIYGAQPKKLAKMLGITEQEAKRLFNEYWEAVPALKELKEKVEAFWEKNGKTFILGLDGRKLRTRSKHSLINVLFQSGGAISAKWSAVFLAEAMEERGILGDPFKHTKKQQKVWWMIHMHDEQQQAVHPKLMQIESFGDDEEKAKAFAKSTEGASAVGHGDKGFYVGVKTTPVECIDIGITKAVEYLKLRVDLGFEWIPGKNWGGCH